HPGARYWGGGPTDHGGGAGAADGPQHRHRAGAGRSPAPPGPPRPARRAGRVPALGPGLDPGVRAATPRSRAAWNPRPSCPNLGNGPHGEEASVTSLSLKPDDHYEPARERQGGRGVALVVFLLLLLAAG